jgi:hypothetical protein
MRGLRDHLGRVKTVRRRLVGLPRRQDDGNLSPDATLREGCASSYLWTFK